MRQTLLDDSKWSSDFFCKCKPKYKTRYKIHPVHGSSALCLSMPSSIWNNIVQRAMRPDLNKPREDCLFSLKLSTCQSISLYFSVCTGFDHSWRSYNVNLHLCKMALGQSVNPQQAGVGTTYLARRNTITRNCACSTDNGCLLILCRSPFTLTMLGLKCVTLYESHCRLVPDVMRVDVLEKWSGVKKYLRRIPWVSPFSFKKNPIWDPKRR